MSERFRSDDNLVFVCLVNSKYVCLDGKHRLEAGKSFLPHKEQWGIALVFKKRVVYVFAATEQSLTILIASHDDLLDYLRNSHSKLPTDSDGDVYRIIR